jgi:hypothetical protein
MANSEIGCLKLIFFSIIINENHSIQFRRIQTGFRRWSQNLKLIKLNRYFRNKQIKLYL